MSRGQSVLLYGRGPRTASGGLPVSPGRVSNHWVGAPDACQQIQVGHEMQRAVKYARLPA